MGDGVQREDRGQGPNSIVFLEGRPQFPGLASIVFLYGHPCLGDGEDDRLQD